MTNVVQFKSKPIPTPQTDDFVICSVTDEELEAFSFRDAYYTMMEMPKFREIIATKSVKAIHLSNGILIAQHVKKDDESAKDLFKAFSKCVETGHPSYWLKALPPHTVGYVYCYHASMLTRAKLKIGWM